MAEFSGVLGTRYAGTQDAGASAPDSAAAHSGWVVVKFGGTSVSSLVNWRNIAKVLAARRASGLKVLVVHSALSGITDRLEKVLEAALRDAHTEVLQDIEARHRALARELQIEAQVGPALTHHFKILTEIADRIALTQELTDRIRARVMASGELLATELGAVFLRAQGLDVTWLDARTLLQAEARGASSKASILSATCHFAPDAATIERLDALTPVIITQGFIATDAQDGDYEARTVLLGRGGSDTSAAYLAAKLSAARLEIWTDVPGMFSANPRATPTARHLRELHYDEAQEIASNGAKVLHPRCILPVRQYRIPLHVYATQVPEMEGTVISAAGGRSDAQVKAVCLRKGITLIAMDSPGMWHQVGFLADAFQVFKDHGMSVDLISTSETNVTVSLDPAANTLDNVLLEGLVTDLSRLCRVQLIGPCASVSLVGRNIRAILHQLGDAFELFEEQKVYLLTQAANDLNFTFVVDEDQGERLVEQLHQLLIDSVRSQRVLGPTWNQLFAPQPETGTVKRAPTWWAQKRNELLEVMRERDAAYVYDRASITAATQALRGLQSVSRVLYAMKANPHPEVLRIVHAADMSFECVSRGEIERVLQVLPDIDRNRILYTPNFAGRDEYAWAVQQGVHVTVDNLYVLRTWPQVFAGQDIFVRIDTGTGRGHHQHVRTAGAHSKFGVPLSELDELEQLARQAEVRIIGLHAHPGSGIFEVDSWEHTARALIELAQRFSSVRVIDVGGGLGVPDGIESRSVDLGKLDKALQSVKKTMTTERRSAARVQATGALANRAHAADAELEIWLEPGRYVVAAAGVLLARVNQLKSKGEMKYIGVATGMNSLIRPALYGAHHDIVNLTRLEHSATEVVNVVGPICESGDILGHDRLLPPTEEGDVLLIANTGAYGHAMSSRYNLREPAEELFI